MKLQNFFKASATRSLLLLAVGIILFSFTTNPGGDTFTIYLNDQLILRDVVLPASSVKTIALPPADVAAILKVHYSHCGKTGMERKLSIRSGGNKTLKTWSYKEDVDMAINTKDLMTLSNGGHPLNLVYASKEIPGGRVLAVLEKSSGSNSLTTGH